jgi:phage shock protein A
VKQSIFARVAQLARANINALLVSAEEPQKMPDQMVRDYSANIREAEAAIAQTIGNVRMAAQNEVVDKLKGGLDEMKGRLHELTAKRNIIHDSGCLPY